LTGSQDGGYIINLSGTFFDRHLVHFSTALYTFLLHLSHSAKDDLIKYLKDMYEAESISFPIDSPVID